MSLVSPLIRMLALSVLAPAALSQSTWYVDANGVPPGTGTALDPYTNLQFAILQPTTLTGDTLLVLPGTYVGNVDYLDKGLDVRSTDGPLATTIVATTSGPAVRMTEFLGGLSRLEGFRVRAEPGLFTTGVYAGLAEVSRCLLVGHQGDVSVFASGSGAFSTFDLWLDQCTISGNDRGVDVDAFNGLVFATNCCIAENGMDVVGLAQFQGSSFDYCLWQNGDHSGVGNLDLPAGLWSAPNDLHLAPGSPCIDAGDPNAPLDPDGSIADIGALPFDPGYVPDATVYCTAKLTSGGCLASIAASGDPSLSNSTPLIVAATDVPIDVVGLAIYGQGPAAVPFQGGTLCVGSPILRTASQHSGPVGAACAGAFAFDFKAYALSGIDATLEPGVLVHAQYWFRDPGDPFTSGLSDAVAFGLGL